MTQALVVPKVSAMFRRGARSIVESKLIPLAIFLSFLQLSGTLGALIAALSWNLAVIAFRLARGSRIPGLVILSAISLGVRTAAALAAGSLVLYFAPSLATTTLVGVAFLASLFTSSPLAERLAHDFCPFEPVTAAHPAMQRFFVRLSLLWAISSGINAALTCWLLLTQTVTTFVIVKSFLGPLFTTATIATAILWFRGNLRRQGMHLEFA